MFKKRKVNMTLQARKELVDEFRSSYKKIRSKKKNHKSTAL